MGCRITILNWSSLNQRNLRNLGVALQMRGVESIKPMAERYSSLAAGENGWVKAIEIEDKKEQG